MDRPQAMQLAAVAMAPLEGEARRGKAVELRDLGQQACLALESLPPVDSPCLGVVLVQIRAMQSLCTSWIDWWDEIQDIPGSSPSLSQNFIHCWGHGQSGLGLFPLMYLLCGPFAPSLSA